eukprot:TRINITY_DN93005_c0_g1_i1.p1 TRINITY_DN93005_c0_g1~~TRINITY_DN93005_c0_g1_i1.p1  ORF type:complete len:1068 (-),score=128.80 TRINITY_DN93005_c0_g1_i1:76-3279(-)
MGPLLFLSCVVFLAVLLCHGSVCRGMVPNATCSEESRDDFGLMQSKQRLSRSLTMSVREGEKPSLASVTMAPAGAGCCHFDAAKKTSIGRLPVSLCMDRCLRDPTCIAADISKPKVVVAGHWKKTPWLATQSGFKEAFERDPWPGVFWQPTVEDYHNNTEYDCNHYSDVSGSLTMGGCPIEDNATCSKKRNDFVTLHHVGSCGQCGHQFCGDPKAYEVNVPRAETLYGWIGPALSEWGCDKIPANPRLVRNSKSGSIYIVEESFARALFMASLFPYGKASQSAAEPSSSVICWPLHDMGLPGTYRCLDGTVNRCPGNATITTWGRFQKSSADMVCSPTEKCYCQRPDAPFRKGLPNYGCGSDYLTVDYSEFSCPTGQLCLATQGFRKENAASACMPVSDDQPVCTCMSQAAVKTQMKGRQCFDGPDMYGDSPCFGFSAFLDYENQFANGSIPFFKNQYICSNGDGDSCAEGNICTSTARVALVNVSQLCKPEPGPCSCVSPFVSAIYTCGVSGLLKQCAGKTVCSASGTFDLSEAANVCLPPVENTINAMLSEITSAIQGITFILQSGNNDCPDSASSSYVEGFNRAACASTCPPSALYFSIDLNGSCHCCTTLTANDPGNGRYAYQIVTDSPQTYGEFQAMAERNLTFLFGFNTSMTMAPYADFNQDPCSIYYTVISGVTVNASTPLLPQVETMVMKHNGPKAPETLQACKPGLEAAAPISGLRWNLTYIANQSFSSKQFARNQKYTFKVNPRMSSSSSTEEALLQSSESAVTARSTGSGINIRGWYTDFKNWLVKGPAWHKWVTYICAVSSWDVLGLALAPPIIKTLALRAYRSWYLQQAQDALDRGDFTPEEYEEVLDTYTEEYMREGIAKFWRRFLPGNNPDEEEAILEAESNYAEASDNMLLLGADDQAALSEAAASGASESELDSLAGELAQSILDDSIESVLLSSSDSVDILTDGMSASRAAEEMDEMSPEQTELLTSLQEGSEVANLGESDFGFDVLTEQGINVDGFAGAADAVSAGEAAIFEGGVSVITEDLVLEVFIPVLLASAEEALAACAFELLV